MGKWANWVPCGVGPLSGLRVSKLGRRRQHRGQGLAFLPEEANCLDKDRLPAPRGSALLLWAGLNLREHGQRMWTEDVDANHGSWLSGG